MECPKPPSGAWLTFLRRYLAFVAAANLAWEMAHLPLYTIWSEGSAREITVAVVHCTIGDVLIATASLIGALLFFGGTDWPTERAALGRVMAAATFAGIGYTIYSEWLNIVVRKSWAYSTWMPIVPIVETGLSPLLQWVVIPIAGSLWARAGLR
ncbi:MAG: hypothetical protein NBV67_01040 [Tagaea sp.]|nr:hypothetical protein [Tagaea sp.]